jgi:hypothetical protein
LNVGVAIIERKKILFNYILGCLIGVGIFILYIILIPGIDTTIDLYKFFDEFISQKNLYNINLNILFNRYYLDIPKNLYMFLSEFLFFGILGYIFFSSNWKKLDISLQFSLIIMILFLPSVTLLTETYWKRFIIILIPFYYIAVSFIYQSKDYSNKYSILKLFIIISIVSTLSVIAMFSYFVNLKVTAPWAEAEIIILGIAAAITSLIAFSKKPQLTIYILGIILSYFMILQGIYFTANYNLRDDGERIGKSLSSI